MEYGLIRDPNAPESAKVHCVLVHGTWANDASWIEPTSPIATAFKKSDGLRNAAFYKFKWSGSVRHSERVQAASLFTSELASEVTRHPSASWVFVAHSHGGNIVMNSAKTIAGDHLVGCVCLATPFFHVSKRNALLRWVLWIALLSTLVFGGYALVANYMIAVLAWVDASWLGQKLNWVNSVLPTFMTTVSKVTATVGAFIFALIALLFACVVVIWNTDEEPLAARISAKRWDDLVPTPVRCLSIWFTPDEAFWAIRLGRALAERVHDVVGSILTWLFPAGALLCFAVASKDAWQHAFAASSASVVRPSALSGMMHAMALGSAGALAFCIVALTLMTALSLFPAIATGSLRVWDHLWLDISVKRVPQIPESLIQRAPLSLHSGGIWRNLLQLPIFGSGRLVHSQAYVDERVFTIVNNWVLEASQQTFLGGGNDAT